MGSRLPRSAVPAAGQLEDYQSANYTQAGAAYRRGDFITAAGLYEKASAAGFDDPVIFYNLGVTYYRLGRLDEAETAFATAAAHDQLAPISYYNLGLVARRQDEQRDARGWFQQVASHPEASVKLKNLARAAITSLPQTQREKPGLLARQETQPKDFLRFSFDTGYGHTSNIYRAPGNAYVDLAQAGTPTVVPLVQAGSFVPLDADVEFRWAPYKSGYFSIRYDFDGKVFTGADHENANAFRNRFSIGGRAFVPGKNGYRYFNSHFTIARYDENYYDRTDGQDQLVGTTDISDRFRRTKFGPHVYYHRERGRLGYGFNGEAFINRYDNDYEEPLEYLDLTHEQYQLGGHLSYDLMRNTALRLSYDRYRRDYIQRKAKNIQGIRFTDNDNLQYDYHDARLRVKQRLGARLDASVTYRYTIRTDNFEGYDDYRRHSGAAELAFRTRRLTIETGLIYQTFDFPNGYAFDLPVAGEKTLDRLYGLLELSYRIRPRYEVVLSAALSVVDSSDPRATYDQNEVAIGIRWHL